jgi:N-acetylmuramoyl-L-alanine amidase CwlA
MCMCDRHLSRRELMRGAMAFGTVAIAGGFDLAFPETALAAVAEPRIYSTSEWGARAASSAVTVLNYKPSYIVVHHTATSNSTATTQSAAFSLARSIQNYHMDNNGWIDTGQQFTVSRGGYITEGRHRTLERLRLGNSFVRGAHVGAGNVNSESVGIENEGLYTSVTPPAALYNKLVELCAHICDKYAIGSNQIFGHRDFMATACPGNILYSKLPQLRTDVAALRAGGTSYTTTVDNATAGRFTASGNWGTSSWSSQKHGADYRYANPVLASDSAWFKVNIPTTRSYLVDAWWPADAGYNDSTPFVIAASGGNQTVVRSQRTNGGQWNNLGTFNLAAGDYNVVGVSRWTSGTGYVIADAVRVRTP